MSLTITLDLNLTGTIVIDGLPIPTETFFILTEDGNPILTEDALNIILEN